MVNQELAEVFGYDYKDLKKYIDNWNPVEELKWISDYPDRRYIRKITDEEREKFDLGWKELKEARPDLNITYKEFVDNKITVDKQERKLFKFLNDKDLSELVGKYKLPKKELYLVISTNFDDMLMCSTKNPWTACTNLENGDYMFTTIGNIFTRGRFIVYVTDMEPKEFKGLKSYNMYFRCFGFINEDGAMTTNIWYPIKEYMTINPNEFIPVNEAGNRVSKYGIDKVYNKFDCFVYPYLDYCEIREDGKFEFKSEYEKFHPVIDTVEEQGTLYHYGDFLKFGGENFNDSLWNFCDECGSIKGRVQTYGDKNYCKSCLPLSKQICSLCGESKHCTITEDNVWLCEDCIPKEFGRSDVNVCRCGTLIKKKKEEECRFCRSGRIDSFKNPDYEYLYKGHKYSYFRHFYMDDREAPPGLKYDEEVFSEHELYVLR